MRAGEAATALTAGFGPLLAICQLGFFIHWLLPQGFRVVFLQLQSKQKSLRKKIPKVRIQITAFLSSPQVHFGSAGNKNYTLRNTNLERVLPDCTTPEKVCSMKISLLLYVFLLNFHPFSFPSFTNPLTLFQLVICLLFVNC